MPSYSLSILRADHTTEFLTFEQTTVVVGREGGDIVTRDPKTSNQHAEFSFVNGTLTFRDLQSTNGSFLTSGERVMQAITLTPGTSLKLGHCTLTVQQIQTGMERGGTEVMPQMQGAPAFAPQQPAPVPVPTPPQASPGPQVPPPAVGGAPPFDPAGSPPGAAMQQVASTTGGLGDQFKHYLVTGVTLYKEHFVNGALTMGLVMVPATVLNVALGWIPIVGLIVSIATGLVELALAPIAAGAMGRWALSAAAGRQLTWSQAWRAALKNPVGEWINVAVAMFIVWLGTLLLVVPGIIVGMFALPAYLLEGKRLVGINLRSAELVMKDAGNHIGLAILVALMAVPPAIGLVVAAIVLNFIPVVGTPLASLLTVTFIVLLLPFIYLVWSVIYFDARKRLENVDPRTESASVLQSW